MDRNIIGGPVQSNETALLVRHNSAATIVIYYSGYSLKL
jgi:hypothetical protein